MNSSNKVKLTKSGSISENQKRSEKMPVLFVGHGSPMNAIDDNEFVQGFRRVADQIPKPAAILCVSAHWETYGTFVTAMQSPRTIHDFGGFPRELYEVEYPAPGNPQLANQTKTLVKSAVVQLDQHWGLDHGAWSVIRQMYPKADIPVVQMSLNRNLSVKDHYRLAKEMMTLRKQGVLIIGSGNIIHNLAMVDRKHLNTVDYAYTWAMEAREKINHYILNNDHQSLINYHSKGKAFELSIPTNEHYLPLLYALALKDENESVELFNDKALAGSLTMTSVKIG